MSALLTRAERELRLAEEDLRREDPAAVAEIAAAFTQIRNVLRKLREQAVKAPGH